MGIKITCGKYKRKFGFFFFAWKKSYYINKKGTAKNWLWESQELATWLESWFLIETKDGGIEAGLKIPVTWLLRPQLATQLARRLQILGTQTKLTSLKALAIDKILLI